MILRMLRMSLLMVLTAFMYCEEERSTCITDDIRHTRTYYPSDVPPNITKFSIVGFFPGRVPLKTRYNRSGFVWFEVAKYTVDQVNKLLMKLKAPSMIQMIAYDTCNSIDIAVTALLEVLLNSTEVNSTSNTCADCCCYDAGNHVIGIIGPASSDIVDVIQKVLSAQKIPLISYSATSVRFDDKDIYPTFMRTIPPDNLQAKMILDLLIYFKWNYVSIVANDDEYGRMGFHELLKLFKLYNICLAYSTFFAYPFDDDTYEVIINNIKREKYSNVIILWASGVRTQGFLTKLHTYDVTNKTWIVTESVGTNPTFVTMDKNIVHGLLSIVPYAGIYRDFEKHFQTLTYLHDSEENQWLNNFFKYSLKLNSTILLQNRTLSEYWEYLPNTKNGYVRDAIYAYATALENYIKENMQCTNHTQCVINRIVNREFFFENYLQKTSFESLHATASSFQKDGNINSTYFHIYSIQPKEKTLQWKKLGEWVQGDGLYINATFTWTGNSKEVPFSQCSATCEPGFYAISYDACCWTCLPCKQGFIKPYVGTEKCEECPEGHTPNKLHTDCIRIAEEYLKYSTTKAIILYVLISLISLTAIFYIVVITRYRGTPMIVSSQYRTSVLQLTSLLLLSLCVMLVTVKPTQLTCATSVTTIGMLHSLAYTFTLIKTQRIIRIFKSALVFTRKMMKTALSVEIGMVIFLLSTNLTILLAFHLYKPFDVERSKIKDGTQTIGCNTKFPLYAQFLYIFILTLVCSVQAFRSRRLPQHYNDAKLLSIAMFTSCMVLIAIVPLYESATNTIDATFVSSLLILIADYIFLLIMYGKKIWTVLMKPHKNDEETFNKNRLRNITKKVNKCMKKNAVAL